MPAVTCQERCGRPWAVRRRTTSHGQRRLCRPCERRAGQHGRLVTRKRTAFTRAWTGPPLTDEETRTWQTSAAWCALQTVERADLDYWQGTAERRWGGRGTVDGTDAAFDRALDGYVQAVVTASARTGLRDPAAAVATVTGNPDAHFQLVRQAGRSGPGTEARTVPLPPSGMARAVDGGARLLF